MAVMACSIAKRAVGCQQRASRGLLVSLWMVARSGARHFPELPKVEYSRGYLCSSRVGL